MIGAVAIDEAGTATVDARWTKSFFPYPHIRLYYVTAGAASIRMHVGKTVPLTPGNLYFLPAFRMFSAHCRHTMTHAYVHFSFSSPDMNSLLLNHSRLSMPVADPRTTAERFSVIIASGGNTMLAARLAGEGALLSLIAPFFSDVRSNEGSRFTSVLSHIESHIAEPVDMATLASLIPLETNYFSNLFARHFGMPPKQYIIRRRIEIACDLLWHTSKKTNEIARAVGFSSDVHFSRTFQSIMRTSPGDYRRCCSRE
ncbi:MAG: AraC family transcriptional regulator [Spirochaetota bacterium]